MPASTVQIGPFVGGLNTFSSETSIADNETTVCENFENDLDGSLRSRPPIYDDLVDMPLGATGNGKLLGYYYGPGLVPYLIASDGLNSTYYFDGTSWILLTNTISATAMVQFDSKAWLVSAVGAANPGGYWTAAGGFVADANMPHGDVIASHKFRLWVGLGKDAVLNGTRMYFSEVLGVPAFWPVAPQFIDIGAGDGQSIVKILVYFNNLLIFRTDSIYSFVYTTNPSAGVVSLVVPGVGLASKDAVESFESFIYFMYDDKAYEFSNNRAQQLNIKVPFISSSRTGIYLPYSVSLFNKRVLFSYFDKLYVFNLKTRTWTTWRSPTFGPIGKVITMAIEDTFPRAILHTSLAVPAGGGRQFSTLFMIDGTTSNAESFQCTVQTKNFNYEASGIFKRLFYWGCDAIFRGTVTASVIPTSYVQSVTWGSLLATTWGTVKNFTWGQPFQPGLTVVTARNTAGSGSSRKFVKFMKSLWFRQAAFKLVFDTDGSTLSAPVQLFSLTTYIMPKERVSKTVT